MKLDRDQLFDHFFDLFFSSSLAFLFLIMKQSRPENQQGDAQASLWAWRYGTPNPFGCWTSRGEEREKKEGAWGVFKGDVGCWNSILRSLREGSFK